jgi:hypothetical protein
MSRFATVLKVLAAIKKIREWLRKRKAAVPAPQPTPPIAPAESEDVDVNLQ